MAYIIVNLVFNESEHGPYRKMLVFEQDREKDGIVISPQENELIMWDVNRELVKIKEKDGISKVVTFVESIYAGDLKVFDYNDFDVKSYTVGGEKKYILEDRRPIKLPIIP